MMQLSLFDQPAPVPSHLFDHVPGGWWCDVCRTVQTIADGVQAVSAWPPADVWIMPYLYHFCRRHLIVLLSACEIEIPMGDEPGRCKRIVVRRTTDPTKPWTHDHTPPLRELLPGIDGAFSVPDREVAA